MPIKTQVSSISHSGLSNQPQFLMAFGILASDTFRILPFLSERVDDDHTVGNIHRQRSAIHTVCRVFNVTLTSVVHGAEVTFFLSHIAA